MPQASRQKIKTPYLNVSEMPGKVAGVPMRRKRNDERSPASELSTRGIFDIEASAQSQSFQISFNFSLHSCSRNQRKQIWSQSEPLLRVNLRAKRSRDERNPSATSFPGSLFSMQKTVD